MVELAERLADEFDAPVGARVVVRLERVEDLAVEDEGAMDAPGAPQRLAERGVIGVAQVAAEPDKHCIEH